MTDDVVLLSYDEAVALLPEGERIHTILDSGIALLGADWDRDQVLGLLRTTDRREVTGQPRRRWGMASPRSATASPCSSRPAAQRGLSQ